MDDYNLNEKIFEPKPLIRTRGKVRSGYTKNHSQGTPKNKRKMSAHSRRINRR